MSTLTTMPNNSTSGVPLPSIELFTNAGYLIAWSLQTIFACPAVMGNSCLIFLFLRAVMIDRAMRVLLVNLALACLMTSLAGLKRAMEYLLNRMSGNADSFTSSILFCQLNALPLICGRQVCVFSLVMIAIERSAAMLWFQKYSERIAYGISILAALSTWIMAIAQQLNTVLVFLPDSASIMLSYCYSSAGDQKVTMISLVVLLFLEVFAIGLYVVVWRTCRHMLLQHQTGVFTMNVTERLRLRRISSVTDNMLPLALAHVLCFTTALLCAFVVYLKAPQLQTGQGVYFLSEYGTALAFLAFPAVNVYICTRHIQPVTEAARKTFPCLKPMSIAPVAEGDGELIMVAHFQALQNLWDAKYKAN